MSILKICFATREYSHPNMGKTGGIGVFLKQFTAELKVHDFDITVFSFGEKAVCFNDAGVHVIRIKDLSGFNEWIKAPLRRYKVPGYITIKKVLEFFNRLYISLYLSVFVKRYQFDLIEFHDYGGDFPYFFGKLPKVVRCHGTAVTLHQFMGYVNRVTDAIFEKLFFRRFSKHVVAVSKTSAEMTQEAFQLKFRPMVIYNGVQITKKSLPKQYLDNSTQPYSVYYFGSVRERKGINIACQVFNDIIENFPHATFHVLGNNNNDYWNTHAKLILTNKALEHTTYYGTIPNDKVNDYLKKAHVVLFPSYGENFSIALLEVMTLGKLVVTSDISAFKEIIVHEENGFIAKNLNDYEAFITTIFTNQVDVNRISIKAKKTIDSRFDYTQIIEENISYYKSLI